MLLMVMPIRLRKLVPLISAVAVLGCASRPLEDQPAKEKNDFSKPLPLDLRYVEPRPNTKYIGAANVEHRFAQYVEGWRVKVERVGTFNYPEEAKGKLYGKLVLSVSINSDGTVKQVEIDRSSGHKILDDAARRIVMMAAPYAPFPPEIQRDTDVLVIIRTWNFTNDRQIETK